MIAKGAVCRKIDLTMRPISSNIKNRQGTSNKVSTLDAIWQSDLNDQPGEICLLSFKKQYSLFFFFSFLFFLFFFFFFAPALEAHFITGYFFGAP